MNTPRGIRNNNPLNIVKGNNWKGEIYPQTDTRFEQFESLEMGIRAGFVILKNYQSKKRIPRARANTIREIVTRWAPASENNTKAYIQAVSKRTGLLPDEVILFQERAKMIALVEAMIFVECGQAIDPELIASAYDLV